MMRIVITGGAGFIGSNLVSYHLKKQDEVIAIDNVTTGTKQNILPFLQNKKFTFHDKDLLTWRGLKDVLSEVDRVYHLAAVVGMFHVIDHPVQTMKVNINATLRLYELLAAQANRPLVLVASSSEVYGNQKGKLSESSPIIIENSLKKQASYAISKLCDETIAMMYSNSYQLPCIIMRIFNTIGLNQSSRWGMVVPRFIKQAIHGEDITIFGDGKQKRSFCDVRDLVALMDLIALVPEARGQIFNLGNDQLISMKDLAKLIKKLSKSPSKLVYVPLKEAYSDEDIFIAERRPNISKVLEYTHYKYLWPLEKTLTELIKIAH